MALQATAEALVFGTPRPFVTITPSPTAVVVTPTPRPIGDIFAQATAVMQLTVQAATTGTPTPLPRGDVVATATPTPRVVTSTPTAENAATATIMVARNRTSLAHRTPPPFVTATPMSSPTPATVARASTAGPLPTPTPLYVLVDAMTATATPNATPVFPAELVGKILFLSNRNGVRQPEAYMINPDGTGLAKLSSRQFYDRAEGTGGILAGSALLRLRRTPERQPQNPALSAR